MANSGVTPRAVNTWEGSMDVDVHVAPEEAATFPQRARNSASPSIPSKLMNLPRKIILYQFVFLSSEIVEIACLKIKKSCPPVSSKTENLSKLLILPASDEPFIR